jgi:uncharacterized membrane protein
MIGLWVLKIPSGAFNLSRLLSMLEVVAKFRWFKASQKIGEALDLEGLICSVRTSISIEEADLGRIEL